MRRRTVGLLLAVGLLLVALSTWAGSDQSKKPVDDFLSDVASMWFDTLYDTVRSEATAPPQASRIYGVSAVALYEAVVLGTLHHRSLVGQLNGLAAVPQPKKHGKYHWPTVANAALARTIRGLFPSLKPENLETINALEQSFSDQFHAEVKKKDYERSVAQGQAVADAILTWAATDEYATVNHCPYIPTPVPGACEPTPPGFTPTPLQPCWGQLRPMVLASGADCAPAGHPEFSTTLHADHGLVPPLEARSFSSFEAAAAEAAVSRLYGGIHFAFDSDDGFSTGQCIGQAITDHVRFKHNKNKELQ